jgi:outer membrane murein-binding lipoprotein Lpp
MSSAPQPVLPPAASADRGAELSTEVADLRAEVARLRQRVDDLEAKVGSARD